MLCNITDIVIKANHLLIICCILFNTYSDSQYWRGIWRVF